MGPEDLLKMMCLNTDAMRTRVDGILKNINLLSNTSQSDNDLSDGRCNSPFLNMSNVTVEKQSSPIITILQIKQFHHDIETMMDLPGAYIKNNTKKMKSVSEFI